MNANRIERTVVTVLCVLAALLVILAVVDSTQPTRTAVASGAAFSRVEHSDLWTQPADPYSPLYEYWGYFQGTGECGYYANTGTEHRNGKVNPGYCNSQPVAQNAPQARPVSNKPTVDGGGETIDKGGLFPPTVDKPAPKSTCEHGNPGNKKCKGNAGENPNSKGTMPKDSTDGNGEHGNQGTGGRNGEHGHGRGGNKS